jgi:hypothetical protein
MTINPNNLIPISTINDTLMIKSSRVIQWMTTIRECPPGARYRILENFWESQIRSKCWLVNSIKKHLPALTGRVYVIGGWYGILSQLIVDNFPTIVYNVDIDDSCIKYGKLLSNDDSRIQFITNDMAKFNKYVDAKLIINTSTEHVTEEKYNEWFSGLPENVPIVVQGNDFHECEDHIRTTESLDEFNRVSLLRTIIYSDKIECPGVGKPFHRFMTIGYK